MTDKLNILLPVETINRELDCRLFLAALCVNKNNRIFIGQHNVIDGLTNSMNGGIYIGKHIFKTIFPNVDVQLYYNLKKRGFKLIFLDEEGAVYSGDEIQWKKALRVQFNPNYLSADDYVCTWGEFQSDFYKTREPACKEHIYPTGHPRFDLYKPKYNSFFDSETNKIREKHGDFVLINTNMASANNGLGLEDTFSLRNNYDPKNSVSRKTYINTWSHNNIVLANFIKLINTLSLRFPNLKFIVRPHPAEDWSLYQTIFKGIENVSVIHEGSVTPWIIASRLIIHDGCTTGIEAALGEKPVINYKSKPDKDQDIFLPDSVSLVCFDEESVIEKVQEILDGKVIFKKEDLDPLVFKLMTNFKEDSFENVKRVIEKAVGILEEEKVKISWNKSQFEKDEKLRKAKNTVKSLIRPMFKEKYKLYKFFRDNHFYGFKQNKIDSKINSVKQIIGKDFSYKFHSEDLIIIESKN